MEKSTVYVVTPTWNNEDYTIRCFESIRKHTKDFVVVWIDNGSERKSRDAVERYVDKIGLPCEKIFNDENLGFVKATNQGMKLAMEAGVKYVVLQNNDTEVYDEWLDRMIRTAEQDQRIGLVGPLASPSHGWQDIDNLKTKRPDEFYDLPEYAGNPEQYASVIRKKYDGKSVDVYPNVAFFCTLIKRGVVEKAGYLSEDFGLGFGDDDDYCARALKAGYSIRLAKDVFIFHNHRTTFKKHFSEDEIREMGKKNQEILKGKHQHYRDLIDRRPKNVKELIRVLRTIRKEEGVFGVARFLGRFSYYILFRRKKSWL